MNKKINSLSTFNGMGCLWYAFDRVGIKVNKRYVSEIDKFANQSNDAAYPDSIHLGDVRNVDVSKLDKIDFYAGGSPCTDLSFAGKQSGLICNSLEDYMELRNEWLKTGNEDLYYHNGKFQQSILFWEWLRILRDIQSVNPDVIFFLENVKMKKSFEKIINDALGLHPVRINSNLQSAQNRDRYYWTNVKTRQLGLFERELITDIPQPKDKGILLKDILQPESEVDKKYYLSSKLINGLFKHADNRNQKFQTHSPNGKAKCITVSHHKQNLDSNYVCVSMVGRRVGEDGKRKDNDKNIPAIQRLEPVSDPNKTNCLTSVSKDNLLTDGYRLRRLTPRECGRLQTFNEDELDVLLNCGVSDSQLYKQFGNGWTIEPIAHILSFLNK